MLPIALEGSGIFKENPEYTEHCLKFHNILSGVGMPNQHLSSKVLLQNTRMPLNKVTMRQEWDS